MVFIVSLMYAEHVLKLVVDWSTLPCTGSRHLSKLFFVRNLAKIPYVLVRELFKNNSCLLDNLETPFLVNCKMW
jgi:hypothetical protein